MTTLKRSRRGLILAGAAILSMAGWHTASASPRQPAAPLQSSSSLGTPTEMYHGVEPCRLVDTRQAGGAMNGAARSFDVTGNLASQGGSSTCNIPTNATSIAVNITGIATRSGGGYVRGWAAGSQPPTATLLNYARPINASNMVNVPLCRGSNCAEAFTLRNFGIDVHLVADVVGYYDSPIYGKVSKLGVLSDSQSITSVAHPSAGVYQLTFDRPVNSCSAQVTDRDFVTGHLLAVTAVNNQPTKLTVWTKSTSNVPTDAEFAISLTC